MSQYRSFTVLEALRADDLGAKRERRKKGSRTENKTPVSRIKMLVFMVIVAAPAALYASTVGGFVVSISTGAALGILVSHARERRKIADKKRQLDYFLPIVMERIVMAVESSLDVLPAIEAVVDLERQSGAALDPVTTLLARIQQHCDAGEGFLDALQHAQQSVSSPSVKHALVHLGIAYREGGEIVQPLRELSDATQLQYQELIEEEIAKMPVKATVPLLCTFAGLIILFLTSPLIQIMKISGQAMPQ